MAASPPQPIPYASLARPHQPSLTASRPESRPVSAQESYQPEFIPPPGWWGITYPHVYRSPPLYPSPYSLVQPTFPDHTRSPLASALVDKGYYPYYHPSTFYDHRWQQMSPQVYTAQVGSDSARLANMVSHGRAMEHGYYAMSCGMPSTLPLSAYSLQSHPIAVPPIPAHPSPKPPPKHAEYFAKHPHLRDEYQISVQQSERTSSRTHHHRMEDGVWDEAQGTAFGSREIWEKASIMTVDDEAPSETTTWTLPAQPPTPPPRNPLRALLQPGTTSSSLDESSGFHTTSPTITASSATTPPGTHTGSCASSTPSLARSECRPPTSLLPPLRPLAANEEISDSCSSSSHYSDSSSGSEYDSDSTVATVDLSPTLRAPRLSVRPMGSTGVWRCREGWEFGRGLSWKPAIESGQYALDQLEERWRRREQRMTHVEEMTQIGMEIGGPRFERYLVDYDSDSSSESDLSP